MAIRTYHDFIVFTYDVEQDEHQQIRSFKVRVFDSPVGQGEEEEEVTINDYARLKSLSRELESRGLDKDLAKQTELGSQLGELLLPPYARELYRDSVEWLKDDEGLRLRLRLAGDLADLPWEYIYLKDAGKQPGLSGFVALHPRISIVRHEALALRAEWLAPPEPAEKRRVVIAMATPQPYTKYPPLRHLPAEQIEIKQALSQVSGIAVNYLPEYDDTGDAGTVPSATFDDIKEALHLSTDIFHFSGHGEFELSPGPGGDSIEGEGWIIFADEHNQAQPKSADELVELMTDRKVRLVVLGACESARRDRFHKLSSVAVSLLTGRIPCVVAMQFTIRDDLAAAFMGAFYEALVAGLVIDEAVALGRGAIRDKMLAGQRHDRDWGVPVLYLRTPGGRIFNPVTDKQARQDAERRSKERFDLNTTWWKWMASDAIATEAQLQHLARASEALELSPVQALLLLRAAEARFVSVTPWLSRLRRVGDGLLNQLDDPNAATAEAPAEAQKILGLDEGTLKDRPVHIGPVAWSAVRHKDRVTRQTAALALTALEPVPDEGLNRLETALEALAESDGYWRRFVRHSELRGTLADADPQIEKRNAGLPPWDRGGIWLWRVWRRLFRDRHRIAGLTLGGAMGAGLGLGFLRALIVIVTPVRRLVGVQFAMYFWWAAILGAALALGMALAEPLLLSRSKETGEPRAIWRAPWHPNRLPGVLAAGLGTLFLGLAHVIVALFNGLSLTKAPLIAPMGFVAGLGLSLALYDQPRAGRNLGPGRWLLRLGTAVLTFVLTQWVFIIAKDKGSGIAVAWAGSFYKAEFIRYGMARWQHLMERYPCCFDYLALLDAALVAIVLTIGLTVGLVIAADWLARWRALVNRSGD